MKSKTEITLTQAPIQLQNKKEQDQLRVKLIEGQGGICPVSGVDITTGPTPHLDHDHETGLCRAALAPAVNRALSQDAMRRFGLPYKDQPRILRAMADYLEQHTPTNYLHLSRKPKELIITETSYKTLGCMVMDNRGCLPSWWGYAWKKPSKRRRNKTHGQKLTKQLAALYKEYDLEPKYYSVAKAAVGPVAKKIKSAKGA
jgi:hypothetical protein